MQSTKASSLKLWIAILMLMMLSAVAVPARGQQAPAVIVGVPEDWSHHHALFSNPGTFDDAMRNRTVDKWSKIVNDRRYKIQQLRRSLRQRPVPERGHRRGQVLKTDWSMDMGPGATVGAGQYPAKFTFATTTSSCSDWVAYNTGAAGVTAGQANIVAYSNLYDTDCSGTVPSAYWAYFTGTGKALTSPVISGDGTKIAFIENPTSGAAVLRILAWHAGEGTPAAANIPDRDYTNTTAGAGGNTAWNATNCPAAGSCLISVAFQNGHQDIISAPFYVYDSDTLYVGDASGTLYEFTGVFNGTPGEVTTGGWPISVSANVLTSPVYDSGASGNIFVADSGGVLYSYNALTAVHQMTSSKLTYAGGTVGIADGPMVDSTTGKVYVFVGGDANTKNGIGCSPGPAGFGCSGVFQFAASNNTIAGTDACDPTSASVWSGTNCGQESVYGKATTLTPTMYDGAFDQIYLVGAGKTGNLWGCAPAASSVPRLSYVRLLGTGGIVAGSNVVGIAGIAITPLTSGTATCSPVTEIWGSGGGTDDYMYLSVSALGTLTTTDTSAACTGACVYNFIVATGGTSTTPGTLSVPTTAYAGIASASGSSGIVIDNTAGSGATSPESQIYFTPLADELCAGTTGGSGNGTGGCAVQTSQSAP